MYDVAARTHPGLGLDWNQIIQSGINTAGSIWGGRGGSPITVTAPTTTGIGEATPVYPQETVQQAIDRLLGIQRGTGYQLQTVPQPAGLSTGALLALGLGGFAVLMMLSGNRRRRR